MEWVILWLWLGLALIVAVAANTRGRNSFAWFVLAIVISPLIAGLLVLALPRQATGQSAGPQKFQPRVINGKLTGIWRICPHCELQMSATAPVCATCYRELSPKTQAELQQMLEKARAKTARSSMVGAIVVATIFAAFIALGIFAFIKS